MKQKVRFLYHRPEGERGVGKAIVGLTWLYGLFYDWKALKYNYSHEECWKPDEDGNFSKVITGTGLSMGWTTKEGATVTAVLPYEQTVYLGECFSSTTRGDDNGVRFAPANEVLGKHPERWDYIEVEVDPERFEVGWQEATKLVGRKYDYLGILGFLNPIPCQDGKKWFCSEVCDWLKYLWRVGDRHKRISPRRSAYLLAKKYGEPKRLKEVQR